MKLSTLARMVFWVAVFVGSVFAPSASAQSAIWLTRPSGQRQLSFVRAGLIKEVLVKEGDYVKAGQMLMRLDESVELEQLKILEMLANDDVRIRYQKAVRDQSSVDLQKLELLAKSGNANSYEIEHAQLEVTKNQASLDISQLELKQAIGDRDEMKARIDQMHLKSPIDGRVEHITLREGEAVDALEKIMLVVRTDPLWVDVPVSFTDAANIKTDDVVAVKFLSGHRDSILTSDDDENDTAPDDAVKGRVIFKATMADTAGKIKVRVELPNPDGIPAGGRVKLWFGQAEKPAAEKKAEEKSE